MHDQRGLPWLESFNRDLRYALRSLRGSPTFTIVALLSLSVAIGANTTIFSVVNAVLLRPLPFPSPEQLVILATGMPGQTQGRPAYRTAEEWQRRSQSFSDIAVRDPVTVTWTTPDGAERIAVSRVSPGMFRLLGIQPIQGRPFSEEEADERRRVALISHRLWQTRFGGAPDVIGTSIVLDGLPSQIIGILPVETLNDAEVWEPHTLFPDWETRRNARGAGSWFVVGRLRTNVTVARAQADMTAIARDLDEGLPQAEQSRGVSVIPLHLQVVGRTPQLALWVLLGAVSCLLLIAIANVASLSLARSVRRGPEIAMKSALGASLARIVSPLLAESLVLATTSGFLGVLLAVGGIRLTQALGPVRLARLTEASLDLQVLGWALALSVLTWLLIGLAPAVRFFRGNFRLSNLEGGRNVSNGLAARGVRRSLVVGEFALAVVLLAGAGLLVRSWLLLQNVELGFKPERVLSMQVSTTGFSNPAQRAGFYARALERVESIPGVESAGVIGDLFISSDGEPIITAEGNAGAKTERVRLRVDEVSRNLFVTLGTPLLRGRFFSKEDSPDSARVAIVNEVMADRLWPGLDPVGRRLKFGPPDSSSAWIIVVGVVGNMRRQGLEIEPIAQMFVPLEQDPSRLATLLVRTSTSDPLKMAGTVQAAVREVERYAPLYGVTTLENRLEAYLTLRRFQTSLLIGFSIVALFLAAIGIYGLTHYSVAMRTREIGIRMAVGAQANAIFRMVIGEGLKLSFTGLALGLAGTLFFGGAASSLLFGVTASDPLTFAIVSALFIAVAVAACCFPALRAMRVEPIVALRQG
jgi:putative ABC transport system permease protein